MASGGGSSSSRAWTQRQNKQFECALAVYDREAPDRWHNIARYMGGTKSADEVRRHFEQLVHDVTQIEAGRVPFPRYMGSYYGSAPAPVAGAGLDDDMAAATRTKQYPKFQR
ncbi:protein RADIALIS-like 3 [Zea mays]|eukprot:XP_008650058.1 protein RADIALIS-like 3 [Zea mays]